MVISTLVRRHDRSFVIRLLEPAINRCLYGDLYNLGVQHRYGTLDGFPGIPVKIHKVFGKFMEFRLVLPSI